VFRGRRLRRVAGHLFRSGRLRWMLPPALTPTRPRPPPDQTCCPTSMTTTAPDSDVCPTPKTD
jgi:hypothetical protein